EKEVADRARFEREVIDICAREQRRIAYDLHDGVGQQLVGIALCAKLLEEQLRGERPSEANKAGMIVKLVNDAARQARLTARNLEGADGVGDLKTALQSLAISISRNCSVKATITADGSSLPISPPVAAQLYRIAQEAVHNAVEHGAAREVQINLTFNHETMVLTIRDNGKGFPSNANGKGMGLRIMRYRAQCIDSQPDLACVGVADNTSDAKRLAEQCKPDLMVLDLRLKAGDALDLIKTLRVERPEIKVLVLSQYDELIFAERALRAGASGYIMKENATDEVLRAVRKVLTGELYFSERVAAAVMQRSLREKPTASGLGLERLSDRELQVFQLLGASCSAREIAEQFHLSRKTIETHCERIKHKLSLHNAAELKQFARKWTAENFGPRTVGGAAITKRSLKEVALSKN